MIFEKNKMKKQHDKNDNIKYDLIKELEATNIRDFNKLKDEELKDPLIVE